MTDREILRLEAVGCVRESRQILTDINLTVKAGERWALIGPNGAGKSTILSMCGAVKHPSRSSLHVLGRKLGPSTSENCANPSSTSTRDIHLARRSQADR